MDAAPGAVSQSRAGAVSGRGDEAAAALSLRARGATLDDIAGQLGVPRSRAGRLIRASMAALGVRTQAELIGALRGERHLVSMPPELTGAERGVAEQVVAGASNLEIAKRRGTSVHTVANQLQSIYEKVGVGSRRELVARLLAGNGRATP